VDTEARRLYIGTGNAYHDPAGPMTDSMLAIDPDTGAILDHFQAVAGDAWNGAEDWPENPDADFGASANLFTDDAGRRLVGQGEKSGVYWALDRDTMEPVWSTITGPGHFTGGVIGSTAFDDERVYGPNTQAGLVWALQRDGGELSWLSSDGSPTAHFGAVSISNGVLYSNDVTGFLTARDAATGLPLARLALGAPAWGGVSVAGGSVFTNTGTGGTDGFIVAFRPLG
jgi:polyvinyl alcohol dehydrogenase (cytochrome)